MPITVDEHMKNIRAIRAQKREAHKRYVEALEELRDCVLYYIISTEGGIPMTDSLAAAIEAEEVARAKIGGKR